jgi:trehalose 2-sulfotransferase
MQPNISYLVCGTARSGSTLLCEALINTGIAGEPEEYFLPQNELIWQNRWGTSTYEEYLAKTIERCTTSNGVFGVKMMWDYFDDFLAKVRELPAYKNLELSDQDLLQNVFPNLHYILIKRRDKVRQAISHAKARQTNIWAVRTEIGPEPTNKPKFSYWQIDFMMQELEALEAAWERYFLVNNIQPFIVVYEDFIENYESTAIQVLEYLGIPEFEHVNFAPRRMRKQADEESEKWIQRYHQLKTTRRRYRFVTSINKLLITFMRLSQLGHVIYKKFLSRRRSGLAAHHEDLSHDFSVHALNK